MWAFPVEQATQNVFSISNRVWVLCQLQAVPWAPGCAARCCRGRKQQAQCDALLDLPLPRGCLALSSRRVSASRSVPANRCSCRIYGVPRDRCASFALYPMHTLLPAVPCKCTQPFRDPGSRAGLKPCLLFPSSVVHELSSLKLRGATQLPSAWL